MAKGHGPVKPDAGTRIFYGFGMILGVGGRALQVFDMAEIRAALAALRLNGANVEVASRWLSLWQDGRPPALSRFDAHLLPAHAPAMAIFEIKRDASLWCIRAGAYCQLAIGFDLTGQDVLAITNNADRDARLDWCWKIVEGAATVSYRAFKPVQGAVVYAQGMSLPFADEKPDGARVFFMHTNWRPQAMDWVEGNVHGDLQSPPERAMKFFAPRDVEQGTLKGTGTDLF